MIYQPAEDSLLLQKTLKKYLKNKRKDLSILDMGSGSGIQILTCKDLGFNNLLAADINKLAVKEIKSKKINAVHSNLFSKINKSFDLLIFNPPYLPEDKREPKDSQIATTAGKKGYELIIKFLKQSLNHLNPDGSILLLFSTLSQPEVILNKSKDLGYNYKKLSSEKIPFEELFVYEFKLS